MLGRSPGSWKDIPRREFVPLDVRARLTASSNNLQLFLDVRCRFALLYVALGLDPSRSLS